jgi:hypothetical protein
LPRYLLDDVVQHKGRFFTSSWAKYRTARPGSLRLAPPFHRQAALAQDYAKMQPMFLAAQPSFEEMLGRLAQAERELNGEPGR